MTQFLVRHVGIVPDYSCKAVKQDVPGLASFEPLDVFEVALTLKSRFVANKLQRDRLEAEAIKGMKHDMYSGVTSRVYEAKRANTDPQVDQILSTLFHIHLYFKGKPCRT